MTFGKFNVDYEQRIYNPERMRKYRLDRAHQMMKKHGLGSMIFFDYDSWRYLGYYSRHNYARRRPGRFLILIKEAGYPFGPADSRAPTGEAELMPWLADHLVLRHRASFRAPSFDKEYVAGQWKQTAEEVKALLKEHKVLDEPCGIDLPSFNMIDSCQKAGITITDGWAAIAEARVIKNEDEIECCRTANMIAESAHWEVCKALRPGVTEWQMAGVAAKALYDLGAEELEGPSFVVCSGYRSGHNVPAMPSDRVVRPGELFVIDINGVGFQGYRTCYYRTHCVGDKPTEAQKDIYNACLEYQLTMEKNIKPGITNHDYAKAVLKVNPKWPNPGWPTPGRYWTPGNHPLGLCSGDPGPGLSATPDGLERPEFTIEKNMVFACEVGCFDWDGKKWAWDGVKLENSGVVTDTGFEVFGRFPFDLITCGLPGVY